MIDACHSMLSKAKVKVTPYSDKVEVKQVTLPMIPYDDDSFDAIAFIQVLHHLDNSEDTKEGKYPQLQKALCEARRVLKPNGVILIDTIFPEALFGKLAQVLVPKTSYSVKKQVIPVDHLLLNLESASFRNIKYVVRPNCNMFRSDAFKDIAIFLDPEMKNMTSLQTLLEKNEELEILRAAVKEEKKNGTYEKFEEEFFQEKRTLGTHFTLYAHTSITLVETN